MTKKIDIKRFTFYLWVALVYMLIWFLRNISNYPGHFYPAFLNNGWRIVYALGINIIFLEYALPFVLRKKKYIIYNILSGIVILMAFVMLWSYGMYAWRYIGIHLGIYTELVIYPDRSLALQAQMAYSTGAIFFFGIARHIYNYIKLKQATQQLLIEKKEAELNYLKSQTNPHFLFNTLNNIYSLARDKSDLAPESILRLSKILRYMLYETGGNYVAIEQELKIITDYIALEKLRYDDSLQINLNHDVEDMKQALPPLLLIPLVENAFKHGVSETRQQPFVDIHLSVRQRQLIFKVKNSTGTSADEELRENIGLSNLRRQLELLFNEYKLSVQQTGPVFSVNLQINLASHV